jgi:exonuclease III
VRDNLSGQSVILLGDFNDNPDDRSLNTLEYGTENALGGIDTAPDSFLHNATERLVEKDDCSYGLRKATRSKGKISVSPAVPGSRSENNRWRNRKHDYRQDVKIKAVLFDQILVSMNLAERLSASGVFDDTSAVKGQASRVRFKGRGLTVTKKGDFASDHVPVWTEITLNAK